MHNAEKSRTLLWGVARQVGSALALVMSAFILFNAPIQAAAIPADGTTCTLVDAITAANTDAATNGCSAGSGADTITLSAPVTLTVANNGSTGLPVITSTLTIEGAGYTIARDSSAGQFRILEVGGAGDLMLNQATITGGDSGGDTGGGISNSGVLTVTNSTIISNSAGSYGGGISNNSSGTLALTNSTLRGNSGYNGGGIYNVQGTVLVTNSTFSSNRAHSGTGGGLYNNRGTLTVRNSTLTGNSAGGGGGIVNSSGVLALARTLVAGNSVTTGAEIYHDDSFGGSITVNQYNLFGYNGNAGTSGFSSGATDLVPSVALTAVLTTTLADNGGDTWTHALVAGSPAIDAATDSGLATDQRGIARPQRFADDIGAVEFAYEALLNGTLCDLVDAITAANTDTATGNCAAGSGADTITLTAPVTLTVINNGANGLPVITSTITIEGAGYTIARDSTASQFRILDVGAAGSLTLNRVTIRGGNMGVDYGSAISNNGVVTVTNSTISDNSNTYYGGGIYNESGSVLTIRNSTISGNTSDYGGGIFNSGTTTLIRTIVAGNNVAEDGPEIYNSGTIVADQYNLIGYNGDARSDSVTLGSTDIVPSVGLAAILVTTLVDDGYGRFIHALVPGSPALDAAGDSGLATDQLGVARAQGLADDIGAVEVGEASINSTICNLIDAIIAANTDTATGDCAAGSGADTITLNFPLTLTTAYTGTNNGLPVITSTLTIEGAGYTIARAGSAGQFRILEVGSAGSLTLNQVTIWGGDSGGNNGGGINNSGVLTITNSTLVGNSTTSHGGGLYSSNLLTITNSTISGNSAGNQGGGLHVASGSTTTVGNSTITGNAASLGGGIFKASTLTLARTLLAGNTASTIGNELIDIGGGFTAEQYNLFGYGGNSGLYNATPGTTDIVPSVALTAVLTTTLADNGGPTLTHALPAGSPAIDAAGDSGLATDQRGIDRPQGTADEIGAFESQLLNLNLTIPTPPTTQFNSTPDATYAAQSPAGVYTITATFRNVFTPTVNLQDIYFQVKRIDHQNGDNYLLNADGGPGQVGARLSIANSALPGSNDQWNQNEDLSVNFLLGLTERRQLVFKVNVYGSTLVSAGAARASRLPAGEYLGSFVFTFDPALSLESQAQQLFLPLVNR